MKNGAEAVKYKYQDDIIAKIVVDGEEYFQASEALALLLLYDKLIINNHWWEDDWDASKKKLFYIGVNCNDVFAWGCTDAEEVMYHELKDVFSYWEKGRVWGTAVWCIIKRKQMPQKPVYEKIQKEGIWDLDKLQKEYNLEDNLW